MTQETAVSNRIIRDITVVGGGTAGWLTALYAKVVFPTKKITVIESPNVSILGAGEGTVPPIISLLDILEIPVSLLIKEAGSTIKNGVKFTNWNNGGETDVFYNCFVPYGNLSEYSIPMERHSSGTPVVYPLAVAEGLKNTEWSYMASISSMDKVPFRSREQYDPTSNPIYRYEPMGNFAIHFDALRLAKILKEIALERGIVYIEGHVVDTTENEHGEVNQLKLEHGAGIDTDFVFDCTGFNSIFAEKFDNKWISYSDHLTVNAAMPFSLEIEEPTPPYTEAVAMKYGWMWKIPLEGRYGCGYVFDSNHISEEEARQEIIDYLGYEPTWPRETAIRFESGRREEPWKKNIITVGLSSSFVEPLEATSIWSSFVSLSRLFGNTELIYKKDQKLVDEYNKEAGEINDDLLKFIYFHYMSGRADTEFWKHYTRENAPENLKTMLDYLDYRNYKFEDFGIKDQYPMDAYYNIGLGIKYKPMLDNLKEFEFYHFAKTHLNNEFHFYKKTIENVSQSESITHDELLEYLKEN